MILRNKKYLYVMLIIGILDVSLLAFVIAVTWQSSRVVAYIMLFAALSVVACLVWMALRQRAVLINGQGISLLQRKKTINALLWNEVKVIIYTANDGKITICAVEEGKGFSIIGITAQEFEKALARYTDIKLKRL